MQNHEVDSMQSQVEGTVPGVADLMQMYEAIEDVYVKATDSMFGPGTTYTSNSTNVERSDAHVGRDSTGT